MAEPFDSAWIKWAWAETHAHKLMVEIDAAAPKLATERIELSAEYEAHRHGFSVIVVSAPKLPRRCSLLLGTAVHAYRSALDHVAWQMVERGSTPSTTLKDAQVRKIGMPLCTRRSVRIPQGAPTWDASIKAKLPGVSRADLASARELQPYHHRGGAERHHLAVLARLDNLDKHRSIQPVLAWPTDGALYVEPVRDCCVSEQGNVRLGTALEVGTKLCRIPCRKTGLDPEVNVYADLSGDPSVDKGILLRPWLDEVGDGICGFLGRLSDPPIGVRPRP